MDSPRPQQNNSTPSLALTGEGAVVSGSVSIPIARASDPSTWLDAAAVGALTADG